MKKKQTFEMKKITRKNNGITLIALVITVIVLLILAGVTIATLTGENGILTRASEAAEQTEISAEKEGISVAYAGALAGKNGETNVNADDMNEEFSKNNTNAEAKDGIKIYFPDSQRWYKIDSKGNITGPYASEDEMGTTLGDVYTDEMIGQKVTYSSNGQSNWIIFGKDESGNVLLTTEGPIADGFNLTAGPKSWLTYEEDLKQACSGYGGKIQGKTIEARSITLEDINYVTGFEVEKLKFDTYTFGPDPGDYANKEVNYYFPSEEKDEDEVENDYWKKAKTEAEAQQFENNWYAYGQMGGQLIYMYSGEPSGADATSMINADRLKYIIGEDGSYEYLVASRSVRVDSSNANFGVARVGLGGVRTNYYHLCNSISDGGSDYEDRGSQGVRPIVVLPSDIEVEENASGQWDIAY